MSEAQKYAQMDPFGVMPGDEESSQKSNWRSWRTKGAWTSWKILPAVLPYMRPYRSLYVIVIFFTIAGSIVALAQPWPLAVMLDSVIGQDEPTSFLKSIFGTNPNRYTLLIFVVGAGFLITILGHGMNVIENYVAAKLEQNMVLDLRSNMFQHTQKLSLTFHDERYTGQLMSLINMQANAVGEIAMAFPPIFQNLLTLIGMLVIALLIDWQVTIVSLVAVPMIYYATAIYGTRIVPRIRQVMRLEWGSLSIVFEAMSMLRVIVSFGREDREFRRFRSQGQTAVDARVKLTVRQTLFTLGVTAATALGTALVLGFGAYHVIEGYISVGELMVLISYIASVYQPLEAIGSTIGHLHQNMVFLKAGMALLATEPEVSEAPDAVDIGRARGAIALDGVTFAYKDRRPAVKNVSFQAEAGQRIAIVGPTGAGKTTLVNLMVRFYDPKEGSVIIDDVDIRQLTLKCLRENVGVVLQEPLLFSGTIAENIRYGRLGATNDEVIAAAKQANAHDFITGLPDGYETELGEGGQQLSGGERQRVCVARAFVKDSPVLILDEPTSSIDSKTENVILDALDKLMVGRTSIMIAHRLSTIRDADIILVMNHGELVEQGTHADLVEQGGLYSQLYEAQTRIRSRSRTEGGVAFEEGLIDSITQEVGDRMHAAAAGGNGAAVPGQEVEQAPATPEPPVTAEPPATAEQPRHVGAPDEVAVPPAEVAPPAGVAPPAEVAPPVHGEPPAEITPPKPDPASEPLEIAASAGSPNGESPHVPASTGPPVTGDGNGKPPARIDPEALNDQETIKMIRDGLRNERGEIVCGFCSRTLLKGESAELFLVPYEGRKRRSSRYDSFPDAGLGDMFSLRRLQGADLKRKLVCEICWGAAEQAGWSPLQVIERDKP